jgi:hypothetical protein
METRQEEVLDGTYGTRYNGIIQSREAERHCQSSCRYPKDFRQGFFTQSVNSLFSTFLKDQRFFADATSP